MKALVVSGGGSKGSFAGGIIEFLNGNDVEKHNLIGRSFVVDNFSKEVVTSKYLELIPQYMLASYLGLDRKDVTPSGRHARAYP